MHHTAHHTHRSHTPPSSSHDLTHPYLDVCLSQELVLDYIFHSLGLSALSLVPHPVLMTEPLANPNYSRSHLSELLFECYAVPAATYAIDSLLAYHYLRSLQPDPSSTALIVSHGYESTTVIPIVDERPQLLQSTRLTPGCHAQHSLILNDLQLDYPEHKAHINEWRAQELCEDYATMLHDNSYDEQLRKVLLYDVDPRHVHRTPANTARASRLLHVSRSLLC